jgi:uncharacterized protein
LTTEALYKGERVFAKRGPQGWSTVVRIVDAMVLNPSWTIVPATRALFNSARAMYSQFDDKDWDVVDCTSFVIMQERKITVALTTDQHFVQAGFRAYLRS